MALQALRFGTVPPAFTPLTRSSFYETCCDLRCPEALGDSISISFYGHLDGAAWGKRLSMLRLEKIFMLSRALHDAIFDGGFS